MNEEEKEAVEILNTFEFRGKTRNYKEISSEDSKSIKIVLNLIEKLQKENEELKAVRKWYFENTVSKICTPEMLNKILRNDYISKQKVKDKIERLKKKRMKKYDNYMGYKIESREQQDIDKKINVLQELIEEREENNGKNI